MQPNHVYNYIKVPLISWQTCLLKLFSKGINFVFKQMAGEMTDSKRVIKTSYNHLSRSGTSRSTVIWWNEQHFVYNIELGALFNFCSSGLRDGNNTSDVAYLFKISFANGNVECSQCIRRVPDDKLVQLLATYNKFYENSSNVEYKS